MFRFLRILLYILIYCSSVNLLAQGQARNWYFGAYAGVSFNASPPTALINGQLNTNEGCSSISDNDGNLLFYSDGIRVWNRNHQQMPNGFGLVGHPSSAQSALIVPQPGNSNLYLLFSVDYEGNPGGFAYSVIDMALDNGMGDVVVATKNTPLFSPATEKVAAVQHSNGVFVWVIAKRFNTNQFYAYLIDCDGVNAPVTSNVGLVEGWPGWGCLAVSPDGTKLASAARSNGFELFDFNTSTGVVSNPILLSSPGEVYGVCFSPNGNLLYGLKIIGGAIYQWNLQAGSTANIISSMVNLGNAYGSGIPYRGGGIQQGPDEKLYITQYNQPYLTRINNPNTIGVGCDIVPNAVSLLGRNSLLGLPPFIVNFLSNSTNESFTYECLNGVIQFTINGNTNLYDSVEWDFGDPASGNLNNSSSLAPTHSYASPNTYNVRLIRNLSCTSDTTFQLVVVEPLPEQTNNVTICQSETYELPGGNTVNVSGVYTDTISTPTGCGSIIITNLSVLPLNQISHIVSICSNETYSLPNGEVINTEGTYITEIDCDLITTSLTVHPTFQSSQNLTICYDSPFTLPDGQIISNSGTYISHLQTDAGCDSIITSFVNVIFEFNITNNVTICPGEAYTLPDGEITSLSGIYIDTLNSSLSCDSIVTTILTIRDVYNLTIHATICANESYLMPNGALVNLPATYTDILQSTHGCDSTVTTILEVLQTYSSNQYVEICNGEVHHRPNGSQINLSGTYTDVITAANGCDSTIITSAIVHSLPEILFAWTPVIVDFNLPEVQFTNYSQGATTWNWEFDNLNSSQQENPIFTFPRHIPGEYNICLTAYSQDGCASQNCELILVHPRLVVHCPNAFTPDGNGLNEMFQPIMEGHDSSDYLFQIFDRWGQKVFESIDPTIGWSGNNNGGDYYVQNDTYIYRIEAKELLTAEKKEFIGHVTVMR